MNYNEQRKLIVEFGRRLYQNGYVPGTGGNLSCRIDKNTVLIDKLNKAISDVIPKYTAHSQKLDFDGDAIEIHAAKTENARKDVKKHFDMLVGDIHSTAGFFEDFYAKSAQQPTQNDTPLAFMGKAFTKKFSPDQGYSFLQRPFSTKDVSHLTYKEQLGILAAKEKDMTKGITDIGAVNKVISNIFSKAGIEVKEIKGVSDFSEALEKAAEEGNNDNS